MTHILLCDFVGMIPEGPLQDRTTVCNLSGKDRLRHLSREFLVIRFPVLLSAQKDISRNRALHPGEKSAVLRKKAYRHVIFRAETHQIRTARDIAETDDPVNGMDRQAQAHLPISFYDNGLALLREIGALGGA